MLMRNVCHDRHIKIAAVDAVLCQPVRGHLKHAMGRACVTHLGKIALHRIGIWRGDM